MCNIGKCRLCGKDNVELKISHIVPKYFYEYIKRNSRANGMRTTQDPNKRVQDGYKQYLLCGDCEQLFSKYEKVFNEEVFIPLYKEDNECTINTNTDKITYFMLSLAWRVGVARYENENETFEATQKERIKIEETFEEWRKILVAQDYSKIRKSEMYIIPTAKIDMFQNNRFVKNNVSMSFKIYGKEDGFYWSFLMIQVPYLLLVINVWNGNKNRLKANQVGNMIKARKTTLPKEIITTLDNNTAHFYKAKDKISENQIENIRKAVKKKAKK